MASLAQLLLSIFLQMMEIEKKPSDYLDELPPVPHSRLDGDDLLRNELQRASRGESLSAMDLERYNLNPPPPNQRSDPAAWQAALDNAHAQLEHQRNRQLNLELLLKFGPITWRAHNEALVSFLDRIKADVTATRGAIDQLNRERKLQQTAAGRELQILEEEYTGLLLKTAELETACRAVESETNSAHSQMPAIALT